MLINNISLIKTLNKLYFIVELFFSSSLKTSYSAWVKNLKVCPSNLLLIISSILSVLACIWAACSVVAPPVTGCSVK